ncbi:uncharacterized protein LOC128362262 [Scomber scombrus]|uniref:Uncharacterized protein LOC128362262 n=1 Tax=Scomber scombrus TaxID=13677 RepID=A0AAV1P2K4_SCOSC
MARRVDEIDTFTEIQPAASQPSTGAGNEDDEQPSCSTSSTLPEYKRRLRGGARRLNVDYCGSLRKPSVSSIHPRLPSPSPSPPPNHHVDPPPSHLSQDTPSLPPRPSSTPT